MNSIYVIQDKKGHVWAATYEERKAIEICKSKGHTYRLIPFYKCDDTRIEVVAGPIPKEYFS